MARLERHMVRAAGRLAPELCVATAAPDHGDLRRVVDALSAPEFEIAAVSFELGELVLETLDRDADAAVLHTGNSLAPLPPMLAQLTKRLPDLAVVAVCRSYGAQDLRRALGAGLDGLVLDAEMGLALPAAVRAACAGQLSIPKQARPRIYRVALTHAEREVLANVAAGRTNSEIAATLHISPSTVKSRLASAFAKLGVGSREEAAAAAMDVEGTDPPAR
jgi:DNA-binding NarL/FixJ family response regulator